MNLKTMEGLLGAGTNIKMTEVPMRVYREAERRGDISTMNRAMGYVTEFTGRAVDYKEETERGMEEEKEELREQERKAREKALEDKKEEKYGDSKSVLADEEKEEETAEKEELPLMYTLTGTGVTDELSATISILK
ncbi:MAG: hypothetical protein NC293_04635 [Roseburia sp.]|nr:hypothetical protein [Roseburia sp.]